jgi:hypothetical protein
MPKDGWKVVSLRTETVESIKAFQILATATQGRLWTLSSAIDLAIDLATEKLHEQKG